MSDPTRQPKCQRVEGCNTPISCRDIGNCGDRVQFGNRPPAAKAEGIARLRPSWPIVIHERRIATYEDVVDEWTPERIREEWSGCSPENTLVLALLERLEHAEAELVRQRQTLGQLVDHIKAYLPEEWGHPDDPEHQRTFLIAAIYHLAGGKNAYRMTLEKAEAELARVTAELDTLAAALRTGEEGAP